MKWYSAATTASGTAESAAAPRSAGRSSAGMRAGGTVSLSLSSASKALPQRPQRTVPRATRSTSAVTRKRVWHSGHWEYIWPICFSV